MQCYNVQALQKIILCAINVLIQATRTKEEDLKSKGEEE
jgi:hypothetical protein